MQFGDARLPERFWSKVIPEPNTGCWLWLASVRAYGAPQYAHEGAMRSAHRVVYKMVRDIDDTIDLKNRCGGRCVNPEHFDAVVHPPRGKHGHSAGNNKRKLLSPTYITWMNMRARCHNQRHENYPHYGARGIAVCDRWRYSFEAFLEDMGERPLGMTIDRIDNDRGYEPGNCRWATAKQQRINQRVPSMTGK